MRYSDGTEIDFDKDGDWVAVDGAQNASIPTGFILNPIVTIAPADGTVGIVEEQKKPNAQMSGHVEKINFELQKFSCNITIVIYLKNKEPK